MNESENSNITCYFKIWRFINVNTIKKCQKYLAFVISRAENYCCFNSLLVPSDVLNIMHILV